MAYLVVVACFTVSVVMLAVLFKAVAAIWRDFVESHKRLEDFLPWNWQTQAFVQVRLEDQPESWMPVEVEIAAGRQASASTVTLRVMTFVVPERKAEAVERRILRVPGVTDVLIGWQRRCDTCGAMQVLYLRDNHRPAKRVPIGCRKCEPTPVYGLVRSNLDRFGISLNSDAGSGSPSPSN